MAIPPALGAGYCEFESHRADQRSAGLGIAPTVMC